MRIIGDGGHAKVVRDLIRPDNEDPLGQYTIIAIGDNATRKRIAEENTDLFFASVVHPKAYVADPMLIGNGTVIMAGAVVQANARIGKHVIINTCASVDHDCVIGDYAHIAPGAHLCGGVTVGEGALVGVGVGVAPGAVIPPWSLVKARRLEMEPLYGS